MKIQNKDTSVTSSESPHNNRHSPQHYHSFNHHYLKDDLGEGDDNSGSYSNEFKEDFVGNFKSSYETVYLTSIGKDYMELESIEMMDLRHEKEGIELIRLQIAQKDSLIKRLNKVSGKEPVRNKVNKLKIELQSVKETNEENQENPNMSLSDEPDKFNSLERFISTDSAVREDPPSLHSNRILSLREADILIKSMSESEMIREISQPFPVDLERGTEASPFLVRRLQLSIAFLVPESKLVPTGEFGLTTEKYVKQVQKSYGFDEDGVVGNELWSRMIGTRL